MHGGILLIHTLCRHAIHSKTLNLYKSCLNLVIIYPSYLHAAAVTLNNFLLQHNPSYEDDDNIQQVTSVGIFILKIMVVGILYIAIWNAHLKTWSKKKNSKKIVAYS